MGEYCVYKHECPDGRCYIGITNQDPKIRWYGGLGYQGSNHEFFRYILAAGWDNIEHIILHRGLSEEEARRIEKEEIIKEGSRVFNVQHVREKFKAIPPSYKEQLESLSDLEKHALDLWYGIGDSDELAKEKWFSFTNGMMCRTILELSSGDPVRVEKELEYIRVQREKRKNKCV